MTEFSLNEKLRGEHAAIRAARRRQRFARRRNQLLLWTLVWYLVFVIVFLLRIPA
jgi:hypothetical protein